MAVRISFWWNASGLINGQMKSFGFERHTGWNWIMQQWIFPVKKFGTSMENDTRLTGNSLKNPEHVMPPNVNGYAHTEIY